LLRLWEAGHGERYLAGAERLAAWLDRVAVRDAAGTHWPRTIGATQRRVLGLTPGSAGIGLLLLRLYAATRHPRRAALAREVLASLRGQAQPAAQGLTWPVFPGEPRRAARCQWCIGEPGIGLSFAAAAGALGDPGLLDTARAAGETTWAAGDARRDP
jgi:lantibiotic modifying enzyme